MLTETDRQRITSNDYADLLLDISRNPQISELFPQGTLHVMNELNAIVYIPASQFTERVISQYGYSVLPACYGLTSQESLDASGVTRLRRIPVFQLFGEGVLIGIIDTGIDYTHPAFRNADGTTRIQALWDQTIESEKYPPDAMYGTVYTRDDINEALQSNNPLEVVPSVDENGHGTALAGIAAGSVNEENEFSGVVPRSELVVVKLKPAKQNLRDFYFIPDNVAAYQENDLMWGYTYILGTVRRNLNRPVAICIGLGSSMGSHDGRGALPYLLSIGATFPGSVAVISAGNEGGARRHFFSTISATDGTVTVELNVGENELGFTMELWGKAPNTYSIDILSPSGEYIPRIAEGLHVSRVISFIFDRTVIYVDYEMIETATGDQVIVMRFQTPAAGIWRFQVYTRGNLEGSFHIWLPMNGFIGNNTYFVQSDNYTTITSPGNAEIPITVTAYNPVAGNNLYQQASRGYTRIGAIKPDFAAPGVNVTCPSPGNGYTTYTGTGVAAAHTAGVSAILLEWGIVRNNYPGITSVEAKRFLIRGANRSENLIYPNRDWGYGILDIFNVFDQLRASSQRI